MHYTQSRKLVFNSDYNSPEYSKRLHFSPKNEYQKHIIKFRDNVKQVPIIMKQKGFSNWILAPESYRPPGGLNSNTITCESVPTPLTLTLGESLIDFNTLLPGGPSVIRALNWSASGSGKASVWTMTFDTTADKKTGDNILLGTAKVKVLDASGTQIPLGTPVNISGLTGVYTFELDPTGATLGTSSADVNVTLTAN
ncbi:hypothetical protein [Citrobacter meridianamericanus]|uniref:hypothetical protein n=1 Tax=Citrobacter meridianamericanus TaxID=2894201 RepID=UPI00351D9312